MQARRLLGIPAIPTDEDDMKSKGRFQFFRRAKAVAEPSRNSSFTSRSSTPPADDGLMMLAPQEAEPAPLPLFQPTNLNRIDSESVNSRRRQEAKDLYYIAPVWSEDETCSKSKQSQSSSTYASPSPGWRLGNNTIPSVAEKLCIIGLAGEEDDSTLNTRSLQENSLAEPGCLFPSVLAPHQRLLASTVPPCVVNMTSAENKDVLNSDSLIASDSRNRTGNDADAQTEACLPANSSRACSSIGSNSTGGRSGRPREGIMGMLDYLSGGRLTFLGDELFLDNDEDENRERDSLGAASWDDLTDVTPIFPKKVIQKLPSNPPPSEVSILLTEPTSLTRDSTAKSEDTASLPNEAVDAIGNDRENASESYGGVSLEEMDIEERERSFPSTDHVATAVGSIIQFSQGGIHFLDRGDGSLDQSLEVTCDFTDRESLKQEDEDDDTAGNGGNRVAVENKDVKRTKGFHAVLMSRLHLRNRRHRGMKKRNESSEMTRQDQSPNVPVALDFDPIIADFHVGRDDSSLVSGQDLASHTSGHQSRRVDNLQDTRAPHEADGEADSNRYDYDTERSYDSSLERSWSGRDFNRTPSVLSKIRRRFAPQQPSRVDSLLQSLDPEFVDSELANEQCVEKGLVRDEGAPRGALSAVVDTAVEADDELDYVEWSNRSRLPKYRSFALPKLLRRSSSVATRSSLGNRSKYGAAADNLPQTPSTVGSPESKGERGDRNSGPRNNQRFRSSPYQSGVGDFNESLEVVVVETTEQGVSAVTSRKVSKKADFENRPSKVFETITEPGELEPMLLRRFESMNQRCGVSSP